jgi:hypothetical protein
MTCHVITDSAGEIIAWVRATRAKDGDPRVVLRPLDPTHILHEDVRVEVAGDDRAALTAALRQAVRAARSQTPERGH